MCPLVRHCFLHFFVVVMRSWLLLFKKSNPADWQWQNCQKRTHCLCELSKLIMPTPTLRRAVCTPMDWLNWLHSSEPQVYDQWTDVKQEKYVFHHDCLCYAALDPDAQASFRERIGQYTRRLNELRQRFQANSASPSTQQQQRERCKHEQTSSNYKSQHEQSVLLTNGQSVIGSSDVANIVVPEGIETIEPRAFERCRALTSLTLPDTLTFIGECAFGSCSSLKSISLPDNITSVKKDTFEYCYNLTSLKLPKFLKSIGNNAFLSCSCLTELNLPDTVTNIGTGAFFGCRHITSLKLPRAMTILRPRVFSNCSGITLLEFSPNLILVSEEAFRDCRGITSLSLPRSVTHIGQSAFSKCTGLTLLELPQGIMSIGDGAFSSCYNLTSLSLPNSLTKIGKMSFFGCTALTSLTLPRTLTIKNIGDNAFQQCINLSSIFLRPHPSSYVFVTWVVGKSKNRINWRETSVKRLSNVLRTISVMAMGCERVRGDHPILSNKVFKGCKRLDIQLFWLILCSWCWVFMLFTHMNNLTQINRWFFHLPVPIRIVQRSPWDIRH